MRNKLMYVFSITVAIVLAALWQTGRVWATPANSGFKATTIAKGTFGDIDVFNKTIVPSSDTSADSPALVWLSQQKTMGSSDLYVQNNVWQPQGSTGWHTHPGHSLIIVTAGAVTEYDGNDPSCKPHVYTAGMGLVDSGGDHVHLIRNEGTVPAATIAVQLIPAGATRRIDAPDPGNCQF